jgi:hypothetical protein
MDRQLFFVNDQTTSTPIIDNSNVEVYDITLNTYSTTNNFIHYSKHL